MYSIRPWYLLWILLTVVNFSACNGNRASTWPRDDGGITPTALAISPLDHAPLDQEEQGESSAPETPGVPSPGSTSRETSPLLPSSELLSYRGESPYAGLGAPFEILYDPAIWELILEEASRRNRLSNLQEPGCIIRLQAGPVGAPQVDKTILAGREWVIHQIRPRIISYTFFVDRYAYMFDVELPEEYEVATTSLCQYMAEEVIETFSLVDDQQAQ